MKAGFDKFVKLIFVAIKYVDIYFSCDAVDRVSNDQISCGASYAISSLAWAFNPLKQEEIIQVLQEIRVTLEYFGGCLDFLLKHEKVFRNA